jgi:hypothetical protein
LGEWRGLERRAPALGARVEGLRRSPSPPTFCAVDLMGSGLVRRREAVKGAPMARSPERAFYEPPMGGSRNARFASRPPLVGAAKHSAIGSEIVVRVLEGEIRSRDRAHQIAHRSAKPRAQSGVGDLLDFGEHLHGRFVQRLGQSKQRFRDVLVHGELS